MTNKTTSTTLHGDEEQTVFPTTPTSTDQQNCGSISTPEVVKSPFNFEVHTDMIQQLTKSPGDGFFFQSRPMFNHGSVDRENNQVSKSYYSDQVQIVHLFYSTCKRQAIPQDQLGQLASLI